EPVIRVPLPVVALATETRAYEMLGAAIGSRAPLYTVGVPAGTGRGAIALRHALDAIVEDLSRQLGSTPRAIDLVAFGAAGSAARLVLHTEPIPAIRNLVLLGTPNLGTRRAIPALRADALDRPAPVAFQAGTYGGAEDQTPEAMARFNRRASSVRGSRVQLVAGIGGRAELSPILECEEHDARVCLESALGGIDEATLHVVRDRHDRLTRSAESLSILLDEIGLGAIDEREIARGIAAPLAAEGDGEDGIGGDDPDGGAHATSEYPTGSIYDGILPPEDVTDLPLQVDTSGGVIIILDTVELGSIFFALRSPAGDEIDPSNAPIFGAEYLTYADGEGRLIQAYRFASAAIGTWTASLANTSAIPIAYRLELWTESDLILDA